MYDNFRSAKYAIGATVAFGLLAACSSAGSGGFGGATGSLSPQLVDRLTGTSVSVNPIGLVRPDRARSWFSPDRKKKAKGTLWISDDAYDTVNVYALPKLTNVMTLNGFSEPQGMCSQKNGAVWIANTGTEQILEYSTAGKEIGSMSDSYGYPVACAVDKYGDLAVTDIFGFNGAGQVLFYEAKTSAIPTELSNPSQYYYYFDGFDPKGDVFVDGKTSAGTFILSECPRGLTSCHTITVSGATIYFPGATQWDRKENELVVFDELCGDTDATCAYSMTISGNTGTITGKTTFDNCTGSELNPFVGALNPTGNEAGGVASGCGSTDGAPEIWAFPAGGKPTAYGAAKLSEPIGATFSK
jgi:hypothetical protein